MTSIDALLGNPVLSPVTSGFVRPGEWFGPLALTIAVVVLGLVWLCARSRSAALRRFLPVSRSIRRRAKTATLELAEEIVSLPGVQDVRIRLTGSSARPRLVLLVLCEESADLGLLLRHIGEESLVRFRAVTGMPELHTVLRFRLIYQEQRIA
jgi:hypothetical protein